ncbi:MAG: hypothetical protein WD768_04810 [Phycisphaeraceae bacterium]
MREVEAWRRELSAKGQDRALGFEVEIQRVAVVAAAEGQETDGGDKKRYHKPEEKSGSHGRSFEGNN